MSPTKNITSPAQTLFVNVGLPIVAAVALLAFFTNPDQAAHLRAIKDTIALRNPDSGKLNPGSNLHLIQYNNYYFFSTASIGDMTVSQGYFGRVVTTNAIIFVAIVQPDPPSLSCLRLGHLSGALSQPCLATGYRRHQPLSSTVRTARCASRNDSSSGGSGATRSRSGL